jgi:hypothetical protein
MGYARVLALVLDPALDDEAFDDPPWLRDVLPDVPSDGAVTLPRGSESAQRGDEFGKSRGLDPIFDLDENRPAVVGRLDGYHRFGPNGSRATDRWLNPAAGASGTPGSAPQPPRRQQTPAPWERW